MRLIKAIFITVAVFISAMALTSIAKAADLAVKPTNPQPASFGVSSPVVEMLGTPYFAIIDNRQQPVEPMAAPLGSSLMTKAPIVSKVGSSIEYSVIPSETPSVLTKQN